jgi:RND family efflux transporter MFP subunit
MNARSLPLLLAAAVLASGCGGSSPSGTAGLAPAVPVRTAPVTVQDLEDSLVLTGTLKPRSQVQLVAEVGARLTKVLRDEGARVARGETLALLDETDYRLAHDRAQAALQLAEANRQHALVERDRADNLKKTGGITEKDHLSAQVNLQLGEASLAQARTEVAIAAQQLSRARVTAPFAGRVAHRHADPGAMLAAGTPLFTLVDDALLEFRAAVPSADFGKVRVGATAELTIDALPGRSIAGRLARLAPLVDERTRSFEVVIEVPGDQGLVGGLFARAVLRVGRLPRALTVPPAALVREGGAPDEAQVFRVSHGKAERLTVKLGLETAQAVQVRQGLEPGDQVVLDPPAALSSGTPVQPQNSGN